jgi:hypothetical protein
MARRLIAMVLLVGLMCVGGLPGLCPAMAPGQTAHGCCPDGGASLAANCCLPGSMQAMQAAMVVPATSGIQLDGAVLPSSFSLACVPNTSCGAMERTVAAPARAPLTILRT